jgi:hypothetical protein
LIHLESLHAGYTLALVPTIYVKLKPSILESKQSLLSKKVNSVSKDTMNEPTKCPYKLKLDNIDFGAKEADAMDHRCLEMSIHVVPAECEPSLIPVAAHLANIHTDTLAANDVSLMSSARAYTSLSLFWWKLISTPPMAPSSRL